MRVRVWVRVWVKIGVRVSVGFRVGVGGPEFDEVRCV